MKSKKSLVFVASFAFFGIVLATSVSGLKPPGPHGPKGSKPAERQPQIEKVKPEMVSSTPEVSVVQVSPNAFTASVTGFGSAEAHYSLTLTSRVNGQVKSVSESFEEGFSVDAGDVLARLENSEYRAALATAEIDYLDAKVEAEQAAAEWKQSGLEGEASALVLKKPQLKQAQAALEKAKIDAENTSLRAPFAGVVISRNIALGSYVQTGAEIGKMVSSDRVDIAVPLSAAEWDLLPSLKEMVNQNWRVTLKNIENNRQWQGTVNRAQQQLDGSTRQRALIVTVDSPFEQEHPLLPGTFVKVDIPGQKIEGIWQLPATAISQKGEIWYINKSNQLQKFATQTLFSFADKIYIKPPQNLTDAKQQVLVKPMNSYTIGTTVKGNYRDNLVANSGASASGGGATP